MNKPNVVTILIDDMGWRDLSCYGSEFYETPNIDMLATNAVSFSNAYAPSPVCSPSRASLLTGKYPACHGVTNWIGSQTKGKLIDAPYQWHMSKSEYTLANALKDAGYATWHVGKWHLGEEEYYPEKYGFQVNIGGCEWGYPIGGYFSPYKNPSLPNGEDGEYLNDRLTDEAISLIKAHSMDKPFYLNLCHYAVHIPIQAPQALVEKYKEKRKRLGLDKINPFIEGENFPCEHKKHLKVIRRTLQSDEVYAAMIENLDANIGRLIQTLKDTDKLENTIILFTSDNGGLSSSEGSPTCNAPLKEGKGWANEGGVRVPFILKMPNAMQGKKSEQIVSLVDFYPTVLRAAGLEKKPEQQIDGVDISDALFGRPLVERPIFWHYPHYGNQGGTPHSAIRLGEWKLIQYYEDGHFELFNINEDISEQQELSKKFPKITKELSEHLNSWRIKVNARIPLPNPEYLE